MQSRPGCQPPRFNPSTYLGIPKKELDVFAHIDMLRMPSRVFIAGAGPSLPLDMRQIPLGSYVIALNRAITYEYPYAMWMVFDKNSPRFSWFHKPVWAGTLIAMGYRLHVNRLAAGLTSRADLTWSSHKMYDQRMLIEGGLQGGATVAGCAAQLAYWGGVDHITLAGVPLMGGLHFDGTQASRSRGVWNQALKFRRLAAQLKAKGVTVDSFCPNGMNLPVVEK